MAATKPNTIHWPWIPDCVLKFPQNNFKIRQTEYTFASKCRFFWYCFMRIKYWLSTQPVQRTHCCNAARGDDTQPSLPLATPPPPNTLKQTPLRPVLPASITQWPDAMSQRPPRRTWAGKYPFVRERGIPVTAHLVPLYTLQHIVNSVWPNWNGWS